MCLILFYSVCTVTHRTLDIGPGWRWDYGDTVTGLGSMFDCRQLCCDICMGTVYAFLMELMGLVIRNYTGTKGWICIPTFVLLTVRLEFQDFVAFSVSQRHLPQ